MHLHPWKLPCLFHPNFTFILLHYAFLNNIPLEALIHKFKMCHLPIGGSAKNSSSIISFSHMHENCCTEEFPETCILYYFRIGHYDWTVCMHSGTPTIHICKFNYYTYICMCVHMCTYVCKLIKYTIIVFLDTIHHPVFLFKTKRFRRWILSSSSDRNLLR